MTPVPVCGNWATTSCKGLTARDGDWPIYLSAIPIGITSRASPFLYRPMCPATNFFCTAPKKISRNRFIIQQIDQDMFPMSLEDMGAHIEFLSMPQEGLDLGGVRVDCQILHHPGGSWAYRIKTADKTLVYATDGEYQDLSQNGLQPYLDFFAGADALIFDSMYTMAESLNKEGWGHSTSLVGVDMAIKCGVKRLVLFHHEPNYNDAKLKEILEKTEQYFSLVKNGQELEIILAVEGGVLEL